MEEDGRRCCQSPLHSSAVEERKAVVDEDCSHDGALDVEADLADASFQMPVGVLDDGWGAMGAPWVANEMIRSVHRRCPHYAPAHHDHRSIPNSSRAAA